MIVSAKGGLMGHHRDATGEPVYDRPEKIVHAFEESLRHLGTDYIDIYFGHIWWKDPRGTEAFTAAFGQLKKRGLLRAAGVSTNDAGYVRHFNQDGSVDVVQLDYSLFNRVPEEDLPYCQERDIGVVVRGPLRMGMLTGKFTPETIFPEGDVRHGWPEEPWFQERLAKVEQLRPLTSPERTMSELALQLVLNHPAVSAAIPGGKNPQQVEQT